MWLWFVLAIVSLLGTNLLVGWLKRRRDKATNTKCSQLLSDAAHTQTPIILITGFLGAGKTTLINLMLASQTHGQRIAVIQNEVGEISLDDDLMQHVTQQSSTLAVFRNGCLCCTAQSEGSDLARIVDTLLTFKNQPNNTTSIDKMDCVVVELSGVADAAVCIQAFVRHQTPQSRFFLGGVIALADAQNLERHRSDQGFRAIGIEAERQLAYGVTIPKRLCFGLFCFVFSNKHSNKQQTQQTNKPTTADTILLTKCSKTSPQSQQSLTAHIHTLNPLATIQHTDLVAWSSRLDIADLLTVRTFSPQLRIDRYPSLAQPLSHNNTTIRSISIQQQCQVDLSLVKQWLKWLLSWERHQVFRVKGILQVADSDCRYIVHVVHDFVSIFADTSGKPANDCRVVVIGKYLMDKELACSSFAKCAVQHTTSTDPGMLSAGTQQHTCRHDHQSCGCDNSKWWCFAKHSSSFVAQTISKG